MTRVMSLGALTASIAHEVNQPLSDIITNANTCLRMLIRVGNWKVLCLVVGDQEREVGV